MGGEGRKLVMESFLGASCRCVGAGVRVTGDSHYLCPEEVYSQECG
jgi:hypothetical protein